MLVTWEAQDVVPGQITAKVGRKERWLIGYDPSVDSKQKYALISLADGMLSHRNMTKLAMAAHLNGCGEQPAELVDRNCRSSVPPDDLEE
jgi:hypothetical protein